MPTEKRRLQDANLGYYWRNIASKLAEDCLLRVRVLKTAYLGLGF